MGKPTGFMEIDRQTSREIAPEERIKNFNEFHIPLHCDEQQAQGARCMDCGVPFCQSGMMIGGMASGCPLNNLIPEWNDLVYQGRWDLAAKRLIATNRYPEFTSRVCPALCEAACTCGMATGSPVAVKENERAIVEYGYESGAIHAVPPPARTGKRVAVVGTGPSGLSVADLLNKRGHKVTMYERADRVGGLLMYGIPNMKLEKWVIDRRVKILKDEGIEFITNADVGRDVSAEELKENYDAVVLCCGAKKPRDIGVPGRDAEGIYFAVDYLTSVTKSLLDSNFADGKAVTAKGKKVLVIGGGDTGNDCVGTAIRQGCTGIMQLEMMPCPPETRAPGNAWPEWPRVLKTDYGQQEAIAVFGHDPREYQTTVKEFYKKDYDPADVRTSIIAALSIKVENPMFENQPKTKFGSKDVAEGGPSVRNFIMDFVKERLDDYLHMHPETADALGKKVASNEKERKAISGVQKKAREMAKKVSLNNKKLRDCKIHLSDEKNDRRFDTMIFITEGNSASGSITASRDVQTQAVFSLRGKPLNSFGLTKRVVYENEEFNLLQAALNIEEDIGNLRYNKVIIATDADVDGMHIRMLIMTFFLQFFPDVIRNNHLFVLQTPLFRVRNKKETIYCYNEEERQRAVNRLGPNPEITRFKGLGEISADEFKEFIGENMRLEQVRLTKEDPIHDMLEFYMGKNTSDRQEFIINNLRIEADYIDELI